MADRPDPVRRATLSDVARAAGVSPAAASFALNGRDGRPSGSPEVRARVEAAASRLGYAPNQHARAMRTGRNESILLALGELRDPWSVALAQEVSDRAQAKDLSTVVLVDDERWYSFLSGHSVDCAFITGLEVDPAERERARELSRRIAVVAFSTLMEPEGLDVVRSSPMQAIEDAWALLSARHERVHFMAMDRRLLDASLSRRQRFVDVADAASAPGEELVRVVPTDLRGARLAAEEWLASEDRPTGVICQTGYLALALQAAAVSVGISVPDELEFLAIGDVPESAGLFDPVSYFGAERVFGRIADLVIDRAIRGLAPPWTALDLDWVFHPGRTTRA